MSDITDLRNIIAKRLGEEKAKGYNIQYLLDIVKILNAEELERKLGVMRQVEVSDKFYGKNK